MHLSNITLKLHVDPEMPELVQKYKDHVQQHNQHVETDPYPNSGFDLFVPEDLWITPDKSSSLMVNHHVKLEMVEGDQSCGFFIFPRSSISKTPLMLSNHTGIIDSGYRGFLFGAFRNLSNTSYKISDGIRLLQICHPSLKPFQVKIVEMDQLSETIRDSGGFGSTGK
jgi:dUTP pyrophosphatase